MITTETGDEYCAAVLLDPGSRYRRLNVPGEEDLTGAGIHFCATCDGPFYKGQEMAGVGGGNSGIEEGLFLTKFASAVRCWKSGTNWEQAGSFKTRQRNIPVRTKPD